MNQTVATPSRPVSTQLCDPAARVTRSLLGYGVIAGPFYVAVVLAQALLIRPGFNLVHEDASLLSNGSLGWIQIANFVLTGIMVLACAAGMRRALTSGPCATWAPRLLGIYGLGLIAAGIFVADPMNGFPPGAPGGHPAAVSIHGMLHIAAAAIGFLSLIAACFALARRFSSLGQGKWALFSRTTGIVFLAGFAGVASGSSSPVVVLGFWLALVIAWTWLAAVSVHLYHRVSLGSYQD